MKDILLFVVLTMILTIQGFILCQVNYLSNVNLLAVAGHNSDLINSLARAK